MITKLIRKPPWFKVWSVITAIALTAALLLTFLPYQVDIDTGGFLSIGLRQKVEAQEPVSTNGMAYAEVNKSGCGVRKGNCQIRLDFYLEPDDVRYYDRYHYLVDTTSPEYLAGYPGEVDKDGYPVDQADYDKWYEGLPRVWVNTPFHSHFIYLPADLTEEDIKAQIDIHLGNFYKAFQDGWDAMQGGMRHGWATETRIQPTDYSKGESAAEYDIRVAECQMAIDTLTEFSYKPDGNITGETFPATEIDVGAAAINRANDGGAGQTYIGLDNPANDTGVIDTVEIWAYSTMAGTNKVGTFYLVSGSSYASRDYETIGTVTFGAKRTFTGLNIDITSGDYIGEYHASGQIEKDITGYAGVLYYLGDGFGSTQSYATYAGDAISLYGTGETAGCSPSISLDQTSWSVNSGNPVSASSTYETAINWCRITNNSGGIVDITVHGHDMTGGGYTWDLADDATPGSMTYGLKAGLDDADDTFDIIVRETETFNVLVGNMADSATQDFGLKIWTPTVFDDGNQKSGNITLTVACV